MEEVISVILENMEIIYAVEILAGIFFLWRAVHQIKKMEKTKRGFWEQMEVVLEEHNRMYEELESMPRAQEVQEIRKKEEQEALNEKEKKNQEELLNCVLKEYFP